MCSIADSILLQCILHLDVTNLDCDQLVKLCVSHQLAAALIYVYNAGHNDYVTPLVHLFSALGQSKAKVGSAVVCVPKQSVWTGLIVPSE